RMTPKGFTYEEVQDTDHRFTPGEHSIPVVSTQDDQESTNHCLFHDVYIFGSNTSLESSISQPSCASLDSRLARVSGSSNTYQSRVLPHTFFLDLDKGGLDVNSASSTPLMSPQSPSETRRRWDKNVWPEVERGLRRNQSVPDMECVQRADEQPHKKHRGFSRYRQQHYTDDREKRQKIIDAVTRRLYPGSGPGFGRRSKKTAEKPHIPGERECRCRRKGVSNADACTMTSGRSSVSAVSTPRLLDRIPSVVSVTTTLPQYSSGNTSLTWRRCSLDSAPGSLLPLPVYRDKLESDKPLSSPKVESAIPIPTRTCKQVTRHEVKTASTLTRTLHKTETQIISAVPQGDKPEMRDQAVG
ncbi:hypothetical protein OTU49_012666, partial [Cherax quadricarinatus]